ncbi:MAG: sigma-70 family RNA polymerase sigma factor [Nanoarchaeota archaeon]|nr:sigma-70 family RNA polymerase sigma factor [Nanoarchaeota archaeon]
MVSPRAYAEPVSGRKYVPMIDLVKMLDEHSTSIATICDDSDVVIYKQPGRRDRLVDDVDVSRVSSLVQKRQEMRDKYVSVTKIAKDRGRDLKYVKRLCKDAKVEIKRLGKGNSVKYGYVANSDISKLDAVEDERVKIDRGFQSLFYVADQLNVDHKTLRRKCVKNSIEIHKFNVKSGDYISNGDVCALGGANVVHENMRTGSRFFGKSSYSYKMLGYQTLNSLVRSWGAVFNVLKSYLGPLNIDFKQKGKVLYISDRRVEDLRKLHDKEERIKKTCRSYDSLAVELGLGRKKIVNHSKKFNLKIEKLVNGREFLTPESVSALKFFFNDLMIFNSLADEFGTHYNSLENICGLAGIPVFSIKNFKGSYILKSHADLLRQSWVPCKGNKAGFLQDAASRVLCLDSIVDYDDFYFDELKSLYRKEFDVEALAVPVTPVFEFVTSEVESEVRKKRVESSEVKLCKIVQSKKLRDVNLDIESVEEEKRLVLRSKDLNKKSRRSVKRKGSSKKRNSKKRLKELKRPVERPDYNRAFDVKARNFVTRSYVADVRKQKIPTIEEERNLAMAVKVKGSESEEGKKLVSSNTPFAMNIASQFFRKFRLNTNTKEHATYTLMDLVQEANIGLLNAVPKFDRGKGVKFVTYAKWWINKRLIAYGAEHYDVIRLPKRKGVEVVRLENAVRKLRAQGEVVTEEVLSVSMGMHKDEVKDLMKASRARKLKSLDCLVKKGDFKSATFGDTIPDESMNVYDVVEGKNKNEALLKVVESLGNKKQELVMRLKWGLDDGIIKTLQEVGDVMGLTRERIRQIEVEALKKLRHPSRVRGLRDFYESE